MVSCSYFTLRHIIEMRYAVQIRLRCGARLGRPMSATNLLPRFAFDMCSFVHLDLDTPPFCSRLALDAISFVLYAALRDSCWFVIHSYYTRPPTPSNYGEEDGIARSSFIFATRDKQDRIIAKEDNREIVRTTRRRNSIVLVAFYLRTTPLSSVGDEYIGVRSLSVVSLFG